MRMGAKETEERERGKERMEKRGYREYGKRGGWEKRKMEKEGWKSRWKKSKRRREEGGKEEG